MKLDEYLRDIKDGMAYGPIKASKHLQLIYLAARLFCRPCSSDISHIPLLFPLSVLVLHTVEFQKRGLPHAHILIWSAGKNHEVSVAHIDELISAEIPDPKVDPLGYALVNEFMVHGPCGELGEKCVCMKNGFCSKRFPKNFQPETTIDENGFAVYRRRDDGRFCWN